LRNLRVRPYRPAFVVPGLFVLPMNYGFLIIAGWIDH